MVSQEVQKLMSGNVAGHVYSYIGPSVWVKAIAGHFGPRLSEWAASVNMLLLGVVYLGPSSVIDSAPYVYFKALFGSQVLPGAVLFTFGFLGLLGLTINGMRKEVTPWLRIVRAGVGFFLFLGLTTCFAMSGVFSTWLAWYPVAVVVEMFNMFRTGRDAGENHHDGTGKP